jgi:hypothetical protein
VLYQNHCLHHSRLHIKLQHWKSQSNGESSVLPAAIVTVETMHGESYEGVTKSFRAGRLERELQMLQLSATLCSCIAILWVSLVSSAAIILCVASQRVFIVVYFVIDSVRKLLDTPSYAKDIRKISLTDNADGWRVSDNSDDFCYELNGQLQTSRSALQVDEEHDAV